MKQNEEVTKVNKPLVPFMPKQPQFVYAYVPYQICPKYFSDIADGYKAGTMFPELVDPYNCALRDEVKK